jgi:hypothetical protein
VGPAIVPTNIGSVETLTNVSAPSGTVILTAQTAVTVETTGTDGKLTKTVPTSFTKKEVVTSGDQVWTVTQIVYNPTGALDQGSSSGSSSSFFNNHGAVAGVFVVVGLAVVAILTGLALLFFRRRRRLRLDREVTAAAAAASAAASRSPLDEEGDMHSSHPTSESYPSTMSQMTQYNNQYPTNFSGAGGYDHFGGSTAVAGTATGAAVAAGAYGATQYSDHSHHYNDAYGDPYSDQYEQAQEHSDGYHAEGYPDQQVYHDAPGYVSPDQGYYYDHAAPYDPTGYAAPAAYNTYDDPFAGGYSEGSVDNTPMERRDPLTVANPAPPPGGTHAQ